MYKSSVSHRSRSVGMSSACRRTSISPTSLTKSRSAMRLNIPSAAFANSSLSVDPYARIPTSAVCSISSYRTGRPNAPEDESPPVSRVRSKRGRRLNSALAAGPDQLVHLELESNGQAFLEDPRCEPSRIQPVRDLVRRRRRREQDGPSPCADLRQDASGEFVIRAIE